MKTETDIRQGIHYLTRDSDISDLKTNRVLSVLGYPPIAEALKRSPIKHISIARLGDKQHPAWYDYRAKSVSINSGRKFGVQFGEEFSPGRTWNMSGATTDKIESMRRSLVQETAHHIEASIPGVKDVVSEAWASAKKNPITGYATQEPPEYFAESLVAYMVERDALLRYDPVGYKMIERAIALMVKAK